MPNRASRDPLAVGITGHRSDRLDRQAAAAVRSALVDLLAGLAGTLGFATAEGWHQASPRVRLYSMLATGADTAGAEAALSLGLPLVAILPFQRERYAEDFTAAEERRTYRALLGQAADVIEPAADDLDDYPYERGGRVLVDAIDLLIAVWDGGAGRGRGGTAAVVDLALGAGRPVVVMPPERPEALELLRRPPAVADRGTAMAVQREPATPSVLCTVADELRVGQRWGGT